MADGEVVKKPKDKGRKKAKLVVPEPQRDLLTEVARKVTNSTEADLPPKVVVGPNQHAKGTREALLEVLLTPKRKRQISQLDQIIVQNARAAVPWSEIGRMTGMHPMDARSRYLSIIQENYDLTPAEQTLIQVDRLEGIINMLQGWAASGDPDHIRLLLEAIKQLREVHGLASNKAEIIVRVLVEAQADVIVKAIQHVIAKMFDSYIIANAVATDETGQPRQLVEVIDGIVYEALDEVRELVQSTVDTQVTA